MNRLDQIKKIIDIDYIPEFIRISEQLNKQLLAVYNSPEPLDDKYEKAFKHMVKFGLCSESELVH